MRATWTNWKPEDMRKAAEAEGQAALASAPLPVRRFLEPLPYFSAFDEYQRHVAGCVDCCDDDRLDCAEGVALMEVAHVGVAEQHLLAANN